MGGFLDNLKNFFTMPADSGSKFIIFKIKFLQERSEYPFIGVNSFFQKFSMILYLKLICKLFDGMIVITQALQEYFGTKIRREARILLLPTLVEPERFTNATSSEITRGRYIAYIIH